MSKAGLSIAIVKTDDEEVPYRLSIRKIGSWSSEQGFPLHCAAWKDPFTGEELVATHAEAVAEFYVDERDVLRTESDVFLKLVEIIADLLDIKGLRRAFETAISETVRKHSQPAGKE